MHVGLAKLGQICRLLFRDLGGGCRDRLVRSRPDRGLLIARQPVPGPTAENDALELREDRIGRQVARNVEVGIVEDRAGCRLDSVEVVPPQPRESLTGVEALDRHCS